jgi:hypothetical protein
MSQISRYRFDQGCQPHQGPNGFGEPPNPVLEMIAFVALLRSELSASVPELLGNMDEMWRRQMRDDRLRSLHLSSNHTVDTMEAHQ